MNTPEIDIIVAIAPDGAIGIGGELLFHVSADLRHFKELTMGHPIIMGRKTFESLPKGALPGRRNIVISHNRHYSANGAEVAMSLSEAIDLCEGTDRVYIIGGAQIYKEAIAVAHCLSLTCFDRTREGADCFFPEIDASQWECVEDGEWMNDDKTGVKFKFKRLVRV